MTDEIESISGLSQGGDSPWFVIAYVGSAAGWVAYTRLSQATLICQGGLHPWVRLFIWLVLTIVWAVASIAVLRAPTSE
jgi:hypothetical protein